MGNNFCCGNKPQNQGEFKMVNNKLSYIIKILNNLRDQPLITMNTIIKMKTKMKKNKKEKLLTQEPLMKKIKMKNLLI